MTDLEWDTSLQPIASAAHPNSHYSSASTRSRCTELCVYLNSELAETSTHA